MKKYLILIILVSVCILAMSTVSATKIIQECHTLGPKHNTTWEVKLYETYYEGIIVSKGKYYERHLDIYEKSVIGCNHSSHLSYSTENFPYRYQTITSRGPNGKPVYTYKLINKNWTENVKINSTTTYSRTSTSEIVRTTTKNFVITTTYKYSKRNFAPLDDPVITYLTIRSRNSKVNVSTIQVKQSVLTPFKLTPNKISFMRNKPYTWKTYKVNSSNRTIKLGKNVIPNHLEGQWNQVAYRVKL